MADELRKVFMAGVGVVAHAVEKTADAISEATRGENRERVKAAVDDLAKKGEGAFEKGKVAGGELFGKIGDAFSGLKNVEADDIKARLSDLADDALDDLERAIGEVKHWRADKKKAEGGATTGMHPESGDKPEGYEADVEAATDQTTTREDAEDLSEGTNHNE
jgi:polyhydroxyalkanoate synthesis regulator phasin